MPFQLIDDSRTEQNVRLHRTVDKHKPRGILHGRRVQSSAVTNAEKDASKWAFTSSSSV